jgi:aromatase
MNTTHTMVVAAPASAVYELIADIRRWPYIFAPTVHVERLCGGVIGERLRLWAVSANGAVRTWTSRRMHDPDELRIRFRQENPAPPVAHMSGEWVCIPLPGNLTSVVLLHEFGAIGDDPANTALIAQSVDNTSTAQLAALKSTAELGEHRPRLVHSFADSITVVADPVRVYDFLYRVQGWPKRMPHVSRLEVDEAVPNVQTIEMDTDGVDGAPRTCRQVRVCFPYDRIVYKRTEPRDLVTAHIGRWRVYPVASGVRVTSHQTVMLSPEACRGGNGSVERAGELIRRELGLDSMVTLMQTKRAVENGRVLTSPRARF